MTHLEIEAKFKIDDLDSFRKKILDLGLKSSGEVFLKNAILNFPDKKIEGIEYLRLRKKGEESIITLKEPTDNETSISIRKETEVEVGDFEKVKYILNRIGLVETFVYEKKREKFKGQGFEVCIDKNPFIGIYVEIEADTEEMFSDIINKLGLEEKSIVKENYRQIFEKYCKDNNLKIKNMTFEEENKLK